MKTIKMILLGCLCSILGMAQTITHGPMIGGVTNSSANVFIRTDAAAACTVQFSTDDFTNIANSFSTNTQASNDFSIIVKANGLMANSRYQVRVLINNQESGDPSCFKTFPTPTTLGNYKLLFASCIFELVDTDSSLFVQMVTEDAAIFTPTGDWGYPDKDNGSTDLYLSNPPTSWAVDYNAVRDIYKERYSSPNSGFFYHSLALDYTHDDHDYLNDNTGGNTAGGFEVNPFGGNFGEPKTISQPPIARLNILKGYQELFPGYPLIDSTEGIFHNYMLGNVEVFVLDTRSARTPQQDALIEVSGNWVLQEPPGHSLLGATQLNWLLDGLKNSTADWKIIVSSVTFNIGYREIMDSLLTIGKGSSPILGAEISGIQISTGLLGAGQLSDQWAGYRSEQDRLLNHIADNGLKNIFVISGDAHSAALDDGANAGLPELMAANLKKANSDEPAIFGNFIGHPVWNKGGSGIGNQNFNNTYGKVEVFGRDSLRMSAIDANGIEVVGHTFIFEIPTGIETSLGASNQFSIYPNPTSDKLFISASTTGQFKITLVDLIGQKVLSANFEKDYSLNVSRFNNGNYIYNITGNDLKHNQTGLITILH